MVAKAEVTLRSVAEAMKERDIAATAVLEADEAGRETARSIYLGWEMRFDRLLRAWLTREGYL